MLCPIVDAIYCFFVEIFSFEQLLVRPVKVLATLRDLFLEILLVEVLVGSIQFLGSFLMFKSFIILHRLLSLMV